MTFHVTYQIVTEESAEQGEAAESGFIDKDLGLREAVNAVFRKVTDASWARLCRLLGDWK